MQTLTIDAVSLESARGFRAALADFQAELTHEDGTYRVTVALNGDQNIVALLNALAEHVTRRASGPTSIDLDGRVFKLHPTDPLEAQ